MSGRFPAEVRKSEARARHCRAKTEARGRFLLARAVCRRRECARAPSSASVRPDCWATDSARQPTTAITRRARRRQVRCAIERPAAQVTGGTVNAKASAISKLGPFEWTRCRQKWSAQFVANSQSRPSASWHYPPRWWSTRNDINQGNSASEREIRRLPAGPSRRSSRRPNVTCKQSTPPVILQ